MPILTQSFTLASTSFRTQVLQRLLFRLLRYFPHYCYHLDILEMQLYRLGLQHDTAAGSDEHGLRPVVLHNRPVHGQRLHPETIRRTFHC